MTSVLSRRTVLAGSLALAGCGHRGAFVQAGGPVGRTRRVLMATNAAPGGARAGVTRRNTLSLLAVDVAMPQGRAPGVMPLGPGGFSVAGTAPIPDLPAELQGPDAPILWIHGFNNTPAEAVYRIAQMAEDLGLPGRLVAFAWPSAARAAGYLHDRDSVLHARSLAKDLIAELHRASGQRVFVLAHSLGGLLALEALREASLEGRPPKALVEGLVLLPPDIDPDVFFGLVEDIGPKPRMLVIVARNDPVLRLSARLSGRPARIGATPDIERLQAAGIAVLDLTGIGDAGNPHFAAATSSEALRLIRSIRASHEG
ncbi:alpha/beta hydrolase [Roseitalea porphyridii]|uniref:Alpha/beta hydrolase n=2 Tax=Roseitalea porphyridii TaxID=1852022 RepID=A0A4P6V4Y5_9HYPH|nr:alpha/beta hydrolase [Roseitalea porphyridii]